MRVCGHDASDIHFKLEGFGSMPGVTALGMIIAALAAAGGRPAAPPHSSAQHPAVQHPAPAAPARPQATPAGNPGDWFPADAYPPEAKAAGLQGRTAFAIDVDAQGRVTGCNIVTSSGSPLLDSTTCNLLVINGRFNPAHDAGGRAVPGVWTSAMVWQLTAPSALTVPDDIADQGALSPAEQYNESVSAAAKAQAAAQDDDQDQSQSAGDQPPGDDGP
jgi:TonB family protein